MVKNGVEARTTWWNFGRKLVSKNRTTLSHTGLTGTVTSLSEALLTTMFRVYRMLNRNSTSSSLALRLGTGLWWGGEAEVSAPAPGRAVLGSIRMRINVPIVPQKACRAVKVYGKGKWMRTDLL